MYRHCEQHRLLRYTRNDTAVIARPFRAEAIHTRIKDRLLRCARNDGVLQKKPLRKGALNIASLRGTQ